MPLAIACEEWLSNIHEHVAHTPASYILFRFLALRAVPCSGAVGVEKKEARKLVKMRLKYATLILSRTPLDICKNIIAI